MKPELNQEQLDLLSHASSLVTFAERPFVRRRLVSFFGLRDLKKNFDVSVVGIESATYYIAGFLWGYLELACIALVLLLTFSHPPGQASRWVLLTWLVTFIFLWLSALRFRQASKSRKH